MAYMKTNKAKAAGSDTTGGFQVQKKNYCFQGIKRIRKAQEEDVS